MGRIEMPDEDSEDEPSDTWMAAMVVVLASLVFGSFVAWLVHHAG